MLIEDLGLLPYEEAHKIQLDRLEARLQGEIPDTLLLLEHPSVITLGRGSHAENILPGNPLPVALSERGGDVTLHLPGQIVGYLIRLLPEDGRDLKQHLMMVEEILLQTLSRSGIAARRREGKTGVWVADRKIASIGVACRRWCTWHGFALNASCDLDVFRHIKPCGFEASIMTSMEAELGQPVSLAAVKRAVGDIAPRLM